MYLSRKTYVKNWGHQNPADRHEVIVKRGGEVRTDIKPDRVAYVIEEAAYWRKANQIHKWFVDNVQDGNDDCGEYEVSVEQLAELVGLCKRVLDSVETVSGKIHTGTTYYPNGKVEEHYEGGQVVAQAKLAEKLLPSQAGFFFGDTEYNQYYLADLRETVEMLEPLLTDDDGVYYYHSSW